VIGGLALLSGALLGLAAAAMPGMAWLYGSFCAVLVILATKLRHCPLPRRLALLLAGMTLVIFSTLRWQQLRVPPSSADTRVLLEGIVASVPVRDGAELRFDAEVLVADGLEARDSRPRRARLSWRDPASIPRVGERWRWLARLTPLSETRNFAGSDPARLAFRDRVHLSARVLPAVLNTRLALANQSIDGARARIAARIHDCVADPDAAALLTALAVGLTAGMSTDQWRVFNATGTTHLVAISGLHVTLFALLAFAGARFAWRWLAFGRRIDREPFALLLGVAAAGGYALLAGFSAPTQRTWLMLGIFALARLQARHISAARTWSLALIGVLLLDVFAPLSAGFWLSFLAVGVILALETTALVPAATAGRFLRLQSAIMLALAPLTFAVFGGVSFAGLWVNFAAIPIISFVLVPVVLAGAFATLFLPALSALCFSIAAQLYAWLWPLLVWAADGDWALWRMSPPAWWFVMAIPASLLLLRRWPLPLRLTAACVALPLVWAPSRMPALAEARLSVLDAARGSAVLIATHSHVVLFDTGDEWNTQGARIHQLVTPALEGYMRGPVDLLVLPGLNADRALGAATLANDREVKRILVGGGWPATSLPVARCEDSRFSWDEVEFATFAAGRGAQYCVLRVAVGEHAILLAGDLNAAAELALRARLPRSALASEVVFMSRHGSSLGSAPEWIEASGATLAIATGGMAGAESREITLARWRKSGARVLDTRRSGALEIGLGTKGAQLLAVARSARYPFAWRRLQ
jgi:competence protein ComEC